MPQSQSRKRQTRSGGDQQDAEDCSGLDQATKRRMRNRLSQRHFRERRFMYIKELEERSKLNAQSESERNRVLAHEAAQLRREMLKLRSKVIKLSLSLNTIGTEVGRILDKGGPVELADREEESHHTSPMTASATPVLKSPEISAGNGSQGFEEEMHIGWGDDTVSERTIHASRADELPASNYLARSEENSTVLREAAVGFDSQLMNATASNNAEQALGLEHLVMVDPEQHSHLDWVHNTSEPLEVDSTDTGPSSDTLSQFMNNQQNGVTVDLHPHNGMFDANPHSVSYGCPDAWIMSFLAPTQNLESCNLGKGISKAARGPQQKGVTGDDFNGVSMTAPVGLSQTGVSFPPGLYPAPGSRTSCESLPIRSRLSEHIEVMEEYLRYQQSSTPEKISCQLLHRFCANMMSLIAHNAWPSIFPLWFKTQAPEIIVPVLTWRLHPTPETYRCVPPDWRPTELQLTVPHSAVIDLVPYAQLRDRVLLYYNGSVALDRLFCELLNSYAIEVTDVSKVLPLEPPGRGYFGVLNIFNAISTPRSEQPDLTGVPLSMNSLDTETDSTNSAIQEVFDDVVSNLETQDGASGGHSPTSFVASRRERRPSSFFNTAQPTSLTEILTTPELALRLSHSIRLYAAKSWRIDESFFNAWPELKFDGYEKIVARGRSCRISTEPEAPVPLTEETVRIYRATLGKVV